MIFWNLKTNSFDYYLALIQCFLTINLILMCLIELFRFLPVVKNFLKIINKNRQKETNKGHQVVLYQVHNYLFHRMSTTNPEFWLCQLFPWFVFIYFSMRLKVFEWDQNKQKVSKHQFILPEESNKKLVFSELRSGCWHMIKKIIYVAKSLYNICISYFKDTYYDDPFGNHCVFTKVREVFLIKM